MKPRRFRWGKQDPSCRYLSRVIAGPFVFRVSTAPTKEDV
jgi:hypothetical protein